MGSRGAGSGRQASVPDHSPRGGFALWPTKTSNYSILASPFGCTGRDIVREFVDSMRTHSIEPCFYIALNMEHNQSEQRSLKSSGGTDAPPLELPPPLNGFLFDAVILEEDLAKGNQRIATGLHPGCSSCTEELWMTITGF